jgi:hypothetical protein
MYTKCIYFVNKILPISLSLSPSFIDFWFLLLVHDRRRNHFRLNYCIHDNLLQICSQERISRIYVMPHHISNHWACWHSGYLLDLYSGSAQFESPRKHRLSQPRFNEFHNSFQASDDIIRRLGHCRFLPNSFPFTIHVSPCHSTLCSLAS